jgi:hypothetical protein
MATILPGGLYAPLPVFFNAQDEIGKQVFTSGMTVSIPDLLKTSIDYEAFAKHAKCNII